LVSYEQNGLEGKLAIAQFEEVFQRGAEQIDHHHIVIPLLARPVHPRYARSTHQSLVYLRLVLQWTRLFVDHRFELDGHFFPGHFVHSVENGSCTDTNQSQLDDKREKDGPQPPIASSSSRRYLPPKVKSMLSKGVEREKEKTGKRLTYYTGFQVVIYGDTNSGVQ
jgi:hypothetical protein